MKDPLRLYCEFKNVLTGKQSRTFLDTLNCESLHINQNYIAKRSTLQNPKETIFKEVVLVPYKEVLSPTWFEIMKIRPQTESTTLSAFIEKFISTMQNYIEETWSTDKFHLFMHSGGWDSRILSAILRKIYRERGEDFIGKIFFACFGSECVHLDKIMKIEGWSKNQYGRFPFNEECFFHQLEFKSAWRRLNGPSAYPINYWTYLIAQLKLNPDNVDFYGAWYFNESFRVPMGPRFWPSMPGYSSTWHLQGRHRNCFNGFLNWAYHAYSVKRTHSIKRILPILNHDTLKHIIESKIVFPKDIRIQILSSLNSELCKIPWLSISRYIPIPKKNVLEMKKDYFHSFYGRKIKPKATPQNRVWHDPWWAHWSAASLIEHLLSTDTKIYFD